MVEGGRLSGVGKNGSRADASRRSRPSSVTDLELRDGEPGPGAHENRDLVVRRDLSGGLVVRLRSLSNGEERGDSVVC